MRKPAFCICENKGADQRLCFRYLGSTIPLLPKCKISSCGRTAWFMLDLMGNLEDRFFGDAAHLRTAKVECILELEASVIQSITECLK